MLDGINALLSVFSDFVKMLFSLPFYDTITVGWLIVGIEIVAIVVTYFVHRMK